MNALPRGGRHRTARLRSAALLALSLLIPSPRAAEAPASASTAASVSVPAAVPAPAPAPEPYRVRCTVILQTRPDRLYCYASNQPFRLLLKEPAQFAHGEVLIASGRQLLTNWIELIPTLNKATVQRLGETNLPPALVATPGELASGQKNFHRVAVVGRVVAHEWMKFTDHHIEVVVLEGADRTFRMNVLTYSNAREHLPVGTEVEVVGLCFVETFADTRGPEVQVDVENLLECRILRPPPWLTLDVARRLVIVGGGFLLMGGLWLVRERRQIGRLREAEREVRQLNGELEQRILERTRELSESNARLKDEVAAREQAETGLRVALAAEKELSELKSRFVSMVSHEFRTPLAIVMSSAEILDTYVDRLPAAERAAHLADIVAAVGQMGKMVDEVLFLTRFEAGRMTCKPADVNLSALCLDLVEEVLAATQHRCPIEFLAPSELPPASADPDLLRHMFGNLLTNAVKYSAPGTHVLWTLQVDGHRACFEVRDHGIGISEADSRQLFTAFHRGANVGNTKGSGLGLVIVKSCVDLHGGKISVESREGMGTLIRVTLPIFPAASAHSSHLHRRQPEPAPESPIARPG